MQCLIKYNSPIGPMTLASDGVGLVGVWFDSQKFFGSTLTANVVETSSPILADAVKWLNDYFKGVRPSYLPSLSLSGSDFRMRVWRHLMDIHYGQLVTYKDIAAAVAKETGREKMSAQAVGGAVGHNPVGIIVPCHRVVASDGSLTGYAGGLDKKLYLLQLEGIDVNRYLPKTNAAL